MVARKLAIILIIIAGCSEDDPDKGCVPVDKALKQIASLTNIVEKGIVAGRPCTVYSGAQIFACQYEGASVYYFTNPASSMSTCGFIGYDCRGDEILNRGLNEAAWDAFESERSDVQELWAKD